MKLSELSTDQSFNVMVELANPINNIVTDDNVVNAIGKMMETGKDMNMYGQVMLVAGRIGEIIPLLLKDHRRDVYSILSVMNERTVEEIAAQRFIETMRQVRDLFDDNDFMDFFKSSAQRAQNERSAPSASSPA